MDNDEVEQVLLQYAKIILQTKDLEEHFVTKTMYQTKMENIAECNIPPMLVVNTKIWQADKVNVMQISESKIKHSHQPILLP